MLKSDICLNKILVRNLKILINYSNYYSFSVPEVDRAKWIPEEAFLLITVHDELTKISGSRIFGKPFWKRVKGELAKYGCRKTPSQCENKWNSLMKLYRENKEKKNQTGAKPIKWIYFKKMDEVMFKKPQVAPPAIGSSIHGYQVKIGKKVQALKQKKKNSEEKYEEEVEKVRQSEEKDDSDEEGDDDDDGAPSQNRPPPRRTPRNESNPIIKQKRTKSGKQSSFECAMQQSEAHHKENFQQRAELIHLMREIRDAKDKQR